MSNRMNENGTMTMHILNETTIKIQPLTASMIASAVSSPSSPNICCRVRNSLSELACACMRTPFIGFPHKRKRIRKPDAATIIDIRF